MNSLPWEKCAVYILCVNLLDRKLYGKSSHNMHQNVLFAVLLHNRYD